MGLKTGAEYLDSIKNYGLEAHILGQKTGDLTEHGLVQPSRQAVGYLIESMHGAGPPMAQRIMIGRQANLEGKISQVENLLGLRPGH